MRGKADFIAQVAVGKLLRPLPASIGEHFPRHTSQWDIPNDGASPPQVLAPLVMVGIPDLVETEQERGC